MKSALPWPTTAGIAKADDRDDATSPKTAWSQSADSASNRGQRDRGIEVAVGFRPKHHPLQALAHAAYHSAIRP
jgi:hypothetical protein